MFGYGGDNSGYRAARKFASSVMAGAALVSVALIVTLLLITK